MDSTPTNTGPDRSQREHHDTGEPFPPEAVASRPELGRSPKVAAGRVTVYMLRNSSSNRLQDARGIMTRGRDQPSTPITVCPTLAALVAWSGMPGGLDLVMLG